MDTKYFTTLLMPSAFALLLTGGTAQAMKTTTGDSMVQKEDSVMVNDGKKDTIEISRVYDFVR